MGHQRFLEETTMQIVRSIVRGVAYLYLRAALKLDYVNYVYGLVDTWTTGGTYDALCDVQNLLIEHHGYHRCPSCHWATQSPNEHLVDGTWCQEQDQEAERWDAAYEAHLAERDAQQI